MKAQELRIGNLINEKGDFHEVAGIKNNGIECWIAYKEYFEWFRFDKENGILLTGEWVEKLGFEKRSITWHDKSTSENVYVFGRYFIEFTSEGPVFAEIYSDGGFKRNHFYRTLHHVHQLQNLYFALTGEELKQV